MLSQFVATRLISHASLGPNVELKCDNEDCEISTAGEKELFEDGIECVSAKSSEDAQNKLLERLELIGKEHMDGHDLTASKAKSNNTTGGKHTSDAQDAKDATGQPRKKARLE